MKPVTVIAGATTNPDRFAWKAARMLTAKGHKIIPLGIKTGEVSGESIIDIREFPEVGEIDTITLYMGEERQRLYQDYFIKLKPKRIIFNPGAENFELE